MWTTPKNNKIKLKAQQNFSEEDAGPFIDQAVQDQMGAKIQQLAMQYGWEGPVITDVNDEAHREATKLAEDYMQSLAPLGYTFGVSESGDWGLWEGEQDDLGGEALFDEILPEMPLEMPVAEHLEMPVEAPMVTNVAASKVVQAQAPTSPPPKVGPEQVARWNNEKQQWDIVPKDQAEMTPQASMNIMDHVTIWSEFNDELRPIRAALPEVGDRVFIKPLQDWGTVVRLEGNTLRVETVLPQRGPTINTYWLQEVELR